MKRLLSLTLLGILSGCANGVVMTEAETLACRTQGCTAWTENEVRTLIGKAASEGFRRGWADAVKQGSKGI